MIILHSIDDLAGLKGPIVLAAGTFDGVHLGHQTLIRRAMEEASSCGGTAVVMTFDRHPAALLRPEKAPRLLTRNDAKIALLNDMGVPALLMLQFNHDLAGVPARDFIASLVSSCKPLRAFCVGSQWSFGKGGEGNVDLLKKLGGEGNFDVIRIEPVMAGGTAISSTRIREAVAAGNFTDAEICLGRPFLLSGSVITGAGLGSKIGFPTANLDAGGMQLPPDGVYAVKAHVQGGILAGVANIGVRPTVDSRGSSRSTEVHLFDASGDYVGKELSLEFIRFLRAEKKFPDLAALTNQIARDCAEAKEILTS